jgi:hypothetical protein
MEQLKRQPLLKKPPTGKFKMQEFQEEDLSFLSDLKASANWSEMGAMKTTTAEWLWAKKLKHIPNPRVLVITTKSGKGTYMESLWEVLPEWDVFTVSSTRTSPVVGSRVMPVDVALPDEHYMRPMAVLAHYHCFTNKACIPQPVKDKSTGLNKINSDGTFEMTEPRSLNLMRTHWDAIIVDEAHRLKNHDAQWTRNIKKLKADFRHVMTGTGFVNNPSEIWSLLNFLYPDVYTSYWKFREHYCMEDDSGGYKKIVGIWPDKEEEFRDLVRRVGVRRTMNECFPDIQEPIETVVPVELNATQRGMYEDIKNELRTLDAKGETLASANVISMLNRLRQIAVATPEVLESYYDEFNERHVTKIKLVEPSSKLDAVMELIEGLEWDNERKDQVVVFSNFRDPLEMLKVRLDKKGIKYLNLRSEMNEKDRYEMWHETWPKKEHQVFLCTLGVGSESINLTSAHRAVFLDQSWSMVQNTQAIGRVYRPGQTEVAQLIYIRADNTVDFRVKDTVDTKVSWFRQIFGVQDVEGDEDE